MNKYIAYIVALLFLVTAGGAVIMDSGDSDSSDKIIHITQNLVTESSGDPPVETEYFSGVADFSWNETAYTFYGEEYSKKFKILNDDGSSLLAELETSTPNVWTKKVNLATDPADFITFTVEGSAGDYTLSIVSDNPSKKYKLEVETDVMGLKQSLTYDIDIDVYEYKEFDANKLTDSLLEMTQYLSYEASDAKKVFKTSKPTEIKYLYARGLPAGLNIDNNGNIVGMPMATTAAAGEEVTIYASYHKDSTASTAEENGIYYGTITLKVVAASDMTVDYNLTTADDPQPIYNETSKSWVTTQTTVTFSATWHDDSDKESETFVLKVKLIDDSGNLYEFDYRSGEENIVLDGVGSYIIYIEYGGHVTNYDVINVIPNPEGIGNAGMIVEAHA